MYRSKVICADPIAWNRIRDSIGGNFEHITMDGDKTPNASWQDEMELADRVIPEEKEVVDLTQDAEEEKKEPIGAGVGPRRAPAAADADEEEKEPHGRLAHEAELKNADDHSADMRSRKWFGTLNLDQDEVCPHASCHDDVHNCGKKVGDMTLDEGLVHIKHVIEELKHKQNGIPTCTYFCAGFHIGTKNGRRHAHFVTVHSYQVRFTRIIKVDPRIHWEPLQGTFEQARNYLNKEGHIFEEGTRPKSTDPFREVLDYVLAGHSETDVMREYPEMYMKHGPQLRLMIEKLQVKKVDLAPVDHLYDWQERIDNIAAGPVDPRKIYAFIDFTGNKGKTWICQYLINKYGSHNVAYFTGGRTQDIVFAYHGEKIVCFDFSRDPEQISYDAIEHLKNGIMFSGKYSSCTKMFNKPHVFLFANFELNAGKLSADRWDITYLPQH